MILDERLEFADATALAGGTGRQLVGDVVDTNATTIAPNTTLDLGTGTDLYLMLQVDTTFTSGGAATVDFELSSDAQAAIATDGSASRHFSTGAIALATLVTGYRIACVKLPTGSYERYLGLVANVGTAALTAGKVNAFLTSDPAVYRSYADYVS